MTVTVTTDTNLSAITYTNGEAINVTDGATLTIDTSVTASPRLGHITVPSTSQAGGTIFNRIVGYSNCNLFSTGVTVQPIEDVALSLDYYHVRLIYPFSTTMHNLNGIPGGPTYAMAFNEKHLADEVDVFYRVAIARPGGWIRRLRKHHVTRTIMVGRVSKGRLFTPWRIVQYLPDWRAFRIYYWRLRGKNTQPDSLLCAVADELESGGILLENSTMYCKEHLATAGVMTGKQVRPSVESDIEVRSRRG